MTGFLIVNSIHCKSIPDYKIKDELNRPLERGHPISYKTVYVLSEDKDQPARPHNMTRVLAARLKTLSVLNPL